MQIFYTTPPPPSPSLSLPARRRCRRGCRRAPSPIRRSPLGSKLTAGSAAAASPFWTQIGRRDAAVARESPPRLRCPPPRLDAVAAAPATKARRRRRLRAPRDQPRRERPRARPRGPCCAAGEANAAAAETCCPAHCDVITTSQGPGQQFFLFFIFLKMLNCC